MTIELPLWMQANSYSARLDRAALAAMLSEGLLTGFSVTQRGAGANMSVDVSAGKAIITGDDQADQGNYYVRSTATENVTGFTAPGSNSRIDIVVLQINDPNAGGAAGSNMVITRIAGIAAASPVAPATPNSALLLATIGPILPATTSITTAMITNVATTATLAFDVVTEATASRLMTEITADIAAATATTSGSTGNLRYAKNNGIVHVWTVSTGVSSATLPVGYRPVAQVAAPALYGTNAAIVSITTAGALTAAYAGNPEACSFSLSYLAA